MGVLSSNGSFFSLYYYTRISIHLQEKKLKSKRQGKRATLHGTINEFCICMQINFYDFEWWINEWNLPKHK